MRQQKDRDLCLSAPTIRRDQYMKVPLLQQSVSKNAVSASMLGDGGSKSLFCFALLSARLKVTFSQKLEEYINSLVLADLITILYIETGGVENQRRNCIFFPSAETGILDHIYTLYLFSYSYTTCMNSTWSHSLLPCRVKGICHEKRETACMSFKQ